MKLEIRIVNLKHSLLKHPTIQIDRRTWLGNPFILGPDGNRATVIEKYKVWFDQQMLSNEEFKEKFYDMCKSYAHYEIVQLACWCSPQPCHGDIIKQAMEEIYHENSLNP